MIEIKEKWVLWRCPKCNGLVLSRLLLNDLGTECPICEYAVIVGEEEK